MSEFDRLDAKIDTLLERFKKTKDERDIIKVSFKNRDNEIKDSRHNIKTLEGEKKQTKTRIDGLVKRINGLIENNG